MPLATRQSTALDVVVAAHELVDATQYLFAMPDPVAHTLHALGMLAITHAAGTLGTPFTIVTTQSVPPVRIKWHAYDWALPVVDEYVHCTLLGKLGSAGVCWDCEPYVHVIAPETVCVWHATGAGEGLTHAAGTYFTLPAMPTGQETGLSVYERHAGLLTPTVPCCVVLLVPTLSHATPKGALDGPVQETLEGAQYAPPVVYPHHLHVGASNVD